MRRRSDRARRASTAVAILLCALQWLGAEEAAGETTAAQLTIVAAGVSRTDGLASLVVDVRSASAASPVSPDAFSVTTGARSQQVDAVPLLSDRLAVGLVVDGSADGRAALQPALAGATDFILGQSLTGAVVVADRAPPTVMGTASAEPADVVRALSAIDAEGRRQTASALTTALQGLTRIPARTRMIVLHTTATDAGGRSPAEVAAELVDAHVPLAVISTASDSAYWREVTALTGGVLVTPRAGDGFAAFDQVTDALRSRYLLTFRPADQPPFPATVRVYTPEGPVTADADLPAAPLAAPETRGADDGSAWPLAVGLAVVGLAVGLFVLVRSRRARPAPSDPPPDDKPLAVPDPPGGLFVSSNPPPHSRNGHDTSTRTVTWASHMAQDTPRDTDVADAPAPQHDLDTDPYRCACGCGRPVALGQSFADPEHLSSWLRTRWESG